MTTHSRASSECAPIINAQGNALFSQVLARELHTAQFDGADAPIDRESDMNRDQLKGVAQQVRGKVNEVVGKATGNRRQQLKGDLQQATGTARKAYGDGKAKIRKLGR